MTKTQGRARVGGPGQAKGRLRHLVVAAALVATALAAAPAARAADLFGHDISWPQCSSAQGGYGLPLPPSSTDFTIIGLTKGLAFTENPCLGTQLSWAAQNDVPVHAYTMATFPTQTQLDTYGDDGPYTTSSRAGRLANVGYAEAQYALASLGRVGWTPPAVWVDVEPRPAQPWPGSTEAQKVENRYVVQGLVRALRDAGVGYGFYSYTNGWQEIVGSWPSPGAPVWATAGTLDYPNEALDRCTQPSFSGGTVYLSQWTDGTRDYNRTCGAYQFTDLPRNLAGLPGVQVTASSVDTDVSPSASSAVDGVAEGYPTELSLEWSSAQEGDGAWVELTWPTPVTLDRVVLHDRPNLDDEVLAGTLTFSDGSTVAVGALPNNGQARTVSFARRAVTSVRFTVTSASDATWASGLAEFEAWGMVGGTPKPTASPTPTSSPSPTSSQTTAPLGANMARSTGVTTTASSEDAGTGQTAPKAVDGVADGYPGDHTREWATVGGKAGSWIQLNWANPVTLNRVVLFDRPNTADQVTGGTLAFSDGSTQSFGSLNNAGGATTVTFNSRTTTSLRVTLTTVSGTTENVGLAELEAWGAVATPTGTNVARTVGTTIQGSSVDAATGQTAAKAADGIADGYPGDYTREWATVGGKAGSWIQLNWANPVTLNRVVLFDRPNTADQVTGGTLTFSDGTTQAVGSLDNNGGATTVTFNARTTTSLRLTITGVSGTTENVGLAEFEAWGSVATSSNVARVSGVNASASSQDTGSGQTAAKAVDGSPAGYPGDHTREWATVGGKVGSWLQLTWSRPVSLTKVVLYDRPNTADQITGGTLTFSDGSTQAVGSLTNAGGATTITFNARTTTSLRLTVTSVSGTTENLGLAELEVWGSE